MNGLFSEHDSRYLTPQEYLHYFELGLAPSLTFEALHQLMHRFNNTVHDMEEDYAELKKYLCRCEEELESLRCEVHCYEKRFALSNDSKKETVKT